MWLLSCFCGTVLFCSDALESLAWASAQIHCQCTTNSKVVYPDGNLFTPEELSTSNTGMCCHNWSNDWLVRWPIMHSCAIPVSLGCGSVARLWGNHEEYGGIDVPWETYVMPIFWNLLTVLVVVIVVVLMVVILTHSLPKTTYCRFSNSCLRVPAMTVCRSNLSIARIPLFQLVSDTWPSL